jgi:hypothetical protein
MVFFLDTFHRSEKTMPAIGKMFIIMGILLVLVGIFLIFGDKIPFLGRLPGDISIKREKFSFYFPITTCIIVSIILTIIASLFKK